MKKLLFSSVLMFLFSLSYAQVGEFLQDIKWGARLGGNYSRIANIHSDSRGRYGFNAGGLAMISISYDNLYYIQPELFYFQKGETNDVKNGKEVYQLDYIDLPILFKAYFSDRDSDFFAEIGPKFSFLVNNKIKNPSQWGEIYHSDAYRSFDFGATLGLGYSYQRRYELDFVVDYGMTDAVKGEKKESSNINNNGAISLNVSYIF